MFENMLASQDTLQVVHPINISQKALRCHPRKLPSIEEPFLTIYNLVIVTLWNIFEPSQIALLLKFLHLNTNYVTIHIFYNIIVCTFVPHESFVCMSFVTIAQDGQFALIGFFSLRVALNRLL
tara:strand:- start:2454 stop:2822 length:369 start_codon:yes stop_codon:yes gene_type:complete